MKINLLLLLLLFLFTKIKAIDTLDLCEKELPPVTIEQCNIHNGDQKNIKCCYVSFKSAGRYFTLCKRIVNIGEEISNFKSKLEKADYSKIYIECSSNYISFIKSIFLIILFIF